MARKNPVQVSVPRTPNTEITISVDAKGGVTVVNADGSVVSILD